jgi:Aspartyl protease
MKTAVRFAILCIVITASSSILRGAPIPTSHAQAADTLGVVYTAPMEVTHGKPYVMVMVNGKGPFRFLIDTGTGGDAIITTELAQVLELPVTGEARLNDPTGKGGQTAPVRRIGTLRVAGVDFYGIKAVEHSLPNADGICQGMLGFTLFRDFLFTLDYVNGKLILAEGELMPDGGKTVLPFRMPDGVPIARLVIGNKEVDAQLDSGGLGLSLPEKLIPQVKLAANPLLFGRGQSLSTRFEIKVAKLATDVRLGDITIDQPWVEINPAFPLANFGACPMQHFIITFDQENHLLRLEGPHKRITLGVTPTPLHLTNQPDTPRDIALVPVG